MAKSKAAAAADAAVNKAREAEATKEPAEGDKAERKGSNAPRARKHNYGIIDEAKIEVMKKGEEMPSLRGDLTGDLTAIGEGCTVAEYKAKGGTRHGLRVLSRRGVINLVHPDGTRYPQGYVKPEPKPKDDSPAEGEEGK